ncbi:MAG: phosphate ABC transporter permease PstA [Chloroflexi bacterium]|nr:phosphate ABC transporter permease PstA [Chloroflexota bacterium]
MSDRLRATSRARHAKDRALMVLAWAALVVAVVPLVAIAWFLVEQGVRSISLEFFTSDPPGDLSASGGGIRNAVVGTLLMTGLATLIAVPAGIALAVFAREIGGRVAGSVRFVVDVLAGLPSIVVGIFVYSLVVVTTGHFSGLAGAVALAVIELPVIVVASDELLRLTDRRIDEGTRALGMLRWRSFLSVFIPTALSGIITGVLLAVSRAIGETAPLIFTALGNNFFTLDMNEPVQAMPLLIYRNALNSAFPAARDRAMGTALVLVVIVLAFNLMGRWIARRARPADQR